MDVPDSPMEAMSDAQREARAKVIQILSEHFDGYVLIVQADCNTDAPLDFWLGAFDGGKSRCLGLMEQYKATLLPKPD